MSDHEDECETMGCDFVVFAKTDGVTTWHCDRCGAEVWEDDNDA